MKLASLLNLCDIPKNAIIDTKPTLAMTQIIGYQSLNPLESVLDHRNINWFVGRDYYEESLFVRQAYFLVANDLYSSLNTALKQRSMPMHG